VRAHDEFGDFGVCAGRYWLRWRAERHLKRAQAQLAHERERLGWTGEWSYYIREVN
jgi:hypothetical protein